MNALTLPKVPREALRRARVCPTQLTETPLGPYAMCAAATELLPEEQARAEAVLAPYFPTGTKFEFFWPVGERGRTPAEWFSDLVARYHADD
jgi:hypothetical protein